MRKKTQNCQILQKTLKKHYHKLQNHLKIPLEYPYKPLRAPLRPLKIWRAIPRLFKVRTRQTPPQGLVDAVGGLAKAAMSTILSFANPVFHK